MMDKQQGAALVRDGVADIRDRAQFNKSNESFKDYYNTLASERKANMDYMKSASTGRIEEQKRDLLEHKFQQETARDEELERRKNKK